MLLLISFFILLFLLFFGRDPPALLLNLLQNYSSYSFEIFRACQGDVDKATALIWSSYLFGIVPKKNQNTKTSLFFVQKVLATNFEQMFSNFKKSCVSTWIKH